MPAITVGMPLYNGARYLAPAIESLLAQDFGDFELVISDNASTDATEQICRGYAAQDARVRYLRLPENRGAAVNFNRLIELARADYFCWAAFDDRWRPSFLRRCHAALVAAPDAVLAHPWVTLIDDDDRPYDVEARDFLDGDADLFERFRAIIQEQWSPLAIYGLMRTPALRRTRRMLSLLGSDTVLLCELALQGRFVAVPEPLWIYRSAGFAQGESYARRSRKSLAIDGRTLAERAPMAVLLSHYLRVAASAPLPPAGRARLAASALRWYTLESTLLPALRAAGTQLLGPERVAAALEQLKQQPWYRKLRRIER